MGVSAVTIVVLFDWHDRFTDENKRNDMKIVWGCFGQALLVGAGLGAAGYARNASGLFGEYMGTTADAASLVAGVGALLLLVVKDHRSPALAYAWVLAYGLGGGAANKLGNALVAWGAILVSGAYALHKKHVVACCYVIPPLGFVAGVLLLMQFGTGCCRGPRSPFWVALPVAVYGFLELLASFTLRFLGKDVSLEASEGTCAPKELCAATWCSCLELSGWFWSFIGLCASLFFGFQKGIMGKVAFILLLVVAGTINLSRGFRVGKQVSDHADEALNAKQRAAENAEFARGVRPVSYTHLTLPTKA